MRVLLLLLVSTVAPLSAQAPGPPPEAPAEAGDVPPAALAAGSLLPTGRWPVGPSYAIAGSPTGVSYIAHGGAVRVLDGADVLAEVVLPGTVYDLALVGSRLYAGVSAGRNEGGLFVVDVTSPTAPAVVGSVRGPNVYGIEVRGATAYLAASNGSSMARLVVADVSTPAAPVIVSATPLSGFSYGLEVVGTTAYVALGAAGLGVVDVSDPAHPVLTTTVALPRYVRRVEAGAVDGQTHLAVVGGSYTDGLGALWLMATAGMSPTTVGEASFGTVAEDVAWHPAEAYVSVAVSYDGIRHLSVGIPSEPTEVGQAYPVLSNLVPGSNRVEPPSLSGYQLVADYYTGWQVILSETLVGYREGGGTLRGLLADPDDASVLWAAAGGYGLVRLQATGSGWIETGRTRDERWNFSTDIATAGDVLYVADGYSGVFVVQRAKGATLAQVTDLPFVDQVDVVGSVLVASGQGQRAYYHIDGSQLVLLGVGDGADAVSLAHAGAVLYAGPRAEALVEVTDLSVPTAPAPVSPAAADGVPVRVRVGGDRLYVHSSSTGTLRVYDVSAPAAPVLAGTVAGMPASATAVAGTVFYTAVGGAGAVTAFDVSDPATIQPVAAATLEAGAPSDIAVTADRVAVATLTAGIYGYTSVTVASEPPPRATLALEVGPTPSRGPLTVRVAADAARVEVLDALGRRVALLADGAVAGPLTWEATGVAPGVYLVRAVAGERVATARVVRVP